MFVNHLYINVILILTNFNSHVSNFHQIISHKLFFFSNFGVAHVASQRFVSRQITFLHFVDPMWYLKNRIKKNVH